ncbi:hypothetical protein BKA56DRAFT_581231 [Ilyonectria sp. MPI-CAGE-AT-0026]|nr:hypothetical protein BKA56DRAFT_581231 [Ilyonectria sp. MPI-CAGE-AT-0026]
MGDRGCSSYFQRIESFLFLALSSLCAFFLRDSAECARAYLLTADNWFCRMCPRKLLLQHESIDQRHLLSFMPAPRNRFRQILQHMHVPGIFLHTINRPRTSFKMLHSSIQGQKCEVYILCVDSILSNYTAMSITYFPKSRQVFGLFLGFDSHTDIEDTALRLRKNRGYIDNPFVLIFAFLQLEKFQRFLQVDNMINEVLNIKWSQKSNRENHPAEGHQDRFCSLFSRVDFVKTQLKIWTFQFDKILQICPQLPVFKPAGDEGFLLSPDACIRGLKEAFEERIMRCEGIQGDISLAFQKDLALARKDVIMAINDVRQMKAIVLITIVFLAATAVAGFMHAPVYNWEGKGYMFWVISVPITTVTILLYLAWTKFCNRARQC